MPHTTTDLATEARNLADQAADLHSRMKDVGGSDGPSDASAAWLALDRLATTLETG